MKNVTFYKFDIEPENNLRLDQLISSRLPEYSRSTIKNWINAEKILVMSEGKLVGFDNHQNLLSNNKIYQQLFSAWNLVN